MSRQLLAAIAEAHAVLRQEVKSLVARLEALTSSAAEALRGFDIRRELALRRRFDRTNVTFDGSM